MSSTCNIVSIWHEFSRAFSYLAEFTLDIYTFLVDDQQDVFKQNESEVVNANIKAINFSQVQCYTDDRSMS